MFKNIFNHKITGYVFIAVSVVILPLFLFFQHINALLFHISMEFTIVIIGVIASLIGILTSQKSGYNLLTRISPSLLFYSILVYIHILTYQGLSVFPAASENVSIQIKTLANLILTLGFFVSVIEYKRKIKIWIKFFVSMLIAGIVSFMVFKGTFPDFVDGTSFTLTKILIELIIICLYLVSGVLIFIFRKTRYQKDHWNFIVIIIFLFLSEFFFLTYHPTIDLMTYFGLATKYGGLLISLYIIIKENLLIPYNNLVYSLVKDRDHLEVMKDEVTESYERLAKSQEVGKVGSWELNLKTGKIWASDQAFKMYWSPIPENHEMDLEVVQAFVDEPDRSRLDKALKGLIEENLPYNITFAIVNDDGITRHLHSVATLSYDEEGNPDYVSGVVHDVTALRNQQEKLEYESMHDHLTGVYNRRFFSDKRIDLSDEKYLPISIVIVDINGLKIINDSFGHHIGNQVLKRLASVLESHTSSSEDFVARIGGDEFAIFFTNTDQMQAEAKMHDIINHISNEKVGNIELSIAYGISSMTALDQRIDSILKKSEDEMYLYKISDSSSVRSKIIDALLKTLYEKDFVSEEHSQRVSEYAFALAKACDMSKKQLNDIKTAGLLHDIGKITISNEILNKVGKLTSAEFRIIKTHPEKGYRIIHSIGDMDIIANYVYQHHEYYNGNGYPKGLSGEDISLEARIISIADGYDAMTSYRDYKSQMTKEEAIEELLRCKGTQFDPNLVDIFIKKVLNDKRVF